MFDIKFTGDKELAKYLKSLDKDVNRIMMEEYTKFGKLVEEGARALAPKDRGDLTDTINSDPAERTSKGISVEVGVGSVYGVRRHEERPRPGTHPKYENGAKFPNYYKNGDGLRTRSKGSWRGEKPGRKYLERAVKATEKDFDEMNERILKRIMEGRR